MMGLSTVDYDKGLKSRMQTLREIMEALKDPKISRIGVYGMPGVGKTTLVSQVAQKAKEEGLFVKVASNTLQNYADKKRVLFVLDDIWEPSNIEILNITGSGHKVLVTSQSQVILSKVGTQKDFLVEPLQAEEALHLFRKEVITNKYIFDNSYDNLMIQIVEECAGLPLTLVDVARTLRNQSVDEWLRVLQQLREGSYLVLQNSVFPQLERSYNSLESDEIRSIFLLSSLLGTRISYEEILRYAVGLNLVEGNDMERARSRVYGMMDSLKKSCLLQDGGSSELATLHDIIYDFSIGLTYRSHMFVAKLDVELTKWPDENMMMKFTHMSLHGSLMNPIHKFPERLNCPELRLFHAIVYDDRDITTVADTIFEGARGLKVLGLKGMILSRLLSSLHLLMHIQTLCLDQCILGDLSMIGALKSLKILSFSGTNIKQLPEEIRQLTSLWSLDLSNCPELHVFPSNVLSQLTQLQELNIENSCSVKWGVEIVVDNGKTSNANLTELNHLGHLTSLGIHIPDAVTLPNLILFNKLIRYKISIGQGGWHWSEKAKSSTSRFLQLNLNNTGIEPFKDGIRVVLERAEGLWFDQLKGVENLVYQLDKNGFPELKHLYVENNSDIQCIIGSVQQFPSVVFPILELFELKRLINLREICSSQLSPMSFGNLRVVRVKSCDMLQFFLLTSAARGLLQLKEMELTTCRNMGAIVAGDKADAAISNQAANDDHLIEFPQLHALTLQSLPQFRAFFSYLKPDLINSYRMLEDQVESTLLEQRKVKVTFPSLEFLKLDNVPKMGNIWPRYDFDLAGWLLRLFLQIKQILKQGRVGSNRLKRLTVSNCEEITYLFSAYPFAEFPMLMEKLEISKCARLTQVIQLEKAEYIAYIGISYPFCCLNSLKLMSLPNLVRVFPANLFLDFPLLKELIIEDCPKMESFAFARIDRNSIMKSNILAQKTGEQLFIAPDLEMLSLRKLHQIGHICDLRNPDGFQNLKNLELSGCSSLKYLFPESVARGLTCLLEIRIFSCDLMEQIVQETSGGASIKSHIILPEVRTLVLENLPKLVSFCSGVRIVNWSSLKKVTIKSCPNIRKFGLGRWLSKMKHQQKEDSDRNIEYLFELWESYANSEEFNVDDSEQLSELSRLKLQALHFTKLVWLQVKNCDERLNDFMSILLERSSCLEHVTIKECKSLKHVFDLDHLLAGGKENGRYFIQLKNLTLLDLPDLTSIWNKDLNVGLGLGSLQSIEIMRCGSLKNVFSNWAAGNLQKLEKLSIHECDMIEEVVAMGTEGHETQKKVIEFPLLGDLELVHLSKFIKFYEGKCALNFPSLKNLKLEHCPQVKALTTTTDEGALDANYPSLQQLRLSNLDSLEEIWQGPFSSVLFAELSELELDACGQLKYVIPSNMLQEFQNLKKVAVMNCDSLEKVWDNHPKVRVFQNLNSLQIIHCKRLKKLFSPSIANYLEQLVTLKLCSCENMEEVLGLIAGDGTMDDTASAQMISFPKLECLILKHLPSLESFCGQSCTFEWPSLKTVRLIRIPKMKMFSPGTHSTPKLSAVYMTFIDKCWLGDLNKTIEHLHKMLEVESGQITEMRQSQLQFVQEDHQPNDQ